MTGTGYPDLEDTIQSLIGFQGTDIKGSIPEGSEITERRANWRWGRRCKYGRKERLTALLHHITTVVLEASYFMMKQDAAAGAGRVTWEDFGNGLEERQHDRVHGGAYRALFRR